jgi:hypothetical protein
MIPDQDAVDIEHGIRCQELVLTGEWKCALRYLAAKADLHLQAMRTASIAILTPDYAWRLLIAWREAEGNLLNLQNHVLGAIEDRNRYVKEILKDQVPEHSLQQLVDMPFKENQHEYESPAGARNA